MCVYIYVYSMFIYNVYIYIVCVCMCTQLLLSYKHLSHSMFCSLPLKVKHDPITKTINNQLDIKLGQFTQ